MAAGSFERGPSIRGGATPRPARDPRFRLICGAAVSATRNAFGELDRNRILNHVGALVERGVDVVAVSTAHGHTKGVGDTVRVLRDAFPKLPIIAGNVTSAAGVEFLAGCGADAIKVGQGPGSICTTRIVAGVGIPQMTALYTCSLAAKKKRVSILADGGITKSGDIVKAKLAGGRQAHLKLQRGAWVDVKGVALKNVKYFEAPQNDGFQLYKISTVQRSSRKPLPRLQEHPA